ncbi:MAG: hypothetical protein ACYS67_02420 [Planctomycetota bacterium]|jgi:hypothetical protein
MFKTATASYAVHLVPLVLHLTSVALVALWLKYPRNLFTQVETCLLFPMGRNPRLINDLRRGNALYNCRETFTDVMSALQNQLFMQNKPNFLDNQMNVSSFITMNYEQRTMNYEIKTNPIQTQYKANSNPIQSQFEPNSNPNKANLRGAPAR